MIHLGDITKIDGSKILPVDAIIGGSPCQDFSIAGEREGLSGARSGLLMEEIRIIKEMHKEYGTAYPRFMVWENVPGALSSNKGEDFRIVLEEIAKISEPDAVIPRPPKGKWGNSGCIVGDGWSIAWRILDSQFWGVPQRRRRITLVADFGGQSAPEILFERKGVPGDFEESGTQKEATSRSFEENSYKAIYDARGNGDGTTSPTLTGDHQNRVTDYTAICVQKNLFSQQRHDEYEKGRTPRKGTSNDAERSAETADNKNGIILDDQGGQQITVRTDGKSPTLRAEMHGNIPCVIEKRGLKVPVIPINTMIETRHKQLGEKTGLGIGKEGDPQFTILAGHEHAVAYAIQSFGEHKENNSASTLRSRDGKDATDLIVDLRGIEYFVRRLTPLECERLQGFPDGWTDIGDYTDSNGKKKKSSDTARYKALGNSIALPPWRWVLKRLCNQYTRPATMGSLFDGIGGFPLIWEEINGKGSCLWASEIEEFPIAVTKIRFSQ